MITVKKGSKNPAELHPMTCCPSVRLHTYGAHAKTKKTVVAAKKK